MEESKEENFRVIIRIRPRTEDERASGAEERFVAMSGGRLGNAEGGQAPQAIASFDHVLGPSASADEVFDLVRGVVEGVGEGISACLFAYGPTGSGKTHTMLGEGGEGGGLMPRAAALLLASASASTGASVSASYLQVYNDEVYDLAGLGPGEGGRAASSLPRPRSVNAMAGLRQGRGMGMGPFADGPLSLRDAPVPTGPPPSSGISRPATPSSEASADGWSSGGATTVVGLSSHLVSRVEDVVALLARGNARRAVRTTNSNGDSSRSHAVLTLTLRVDSAGTDGQLQSSRISRLCLVDLAGSERWGAARSDPGALSAPAPSGATIVPQRKFSFTIGSVTVTGKGEASGGGASPSLPPSSASSIAPIPDARKETAARERELRHINASLSALGNVIAALAEGSRAAASAAATGSLAPPPPFVPYRDSTLTRLLRTELGGGGGRAVLLATLSPCEGEEGIATLQFAMRTAAVKSALRRRVEVPATVQLAKAKAEIVRLRALLAAREDSGGEVAARERVVLPTLASPPRPRRPLIAPSFANSPFAAWPGRRRASLGGSPPKRAWDGKTAIVTSPPPARLSSTTRRPRELSPASPLPRGGRIYSPTRPPPSSKGSSAMQRGTSRAAFALPSSLLASPPAPLSLSLRSRAGAGGIGINPFEHALELLKAAQGSTGASPEALRRMTRALEKGRKAVASSPKERAKLAAAMRSASHVPSPRLSRGQVPARTARPSLPSPGRSRGLPAPLVLSPSPGRAPSPGPGPLTLEEDVEGGWTSSVAPTPAEPSPSALAEPGGGFAVGSALARAREKRGEEGWRDPLGGGWEPGLTAGGLSVHGWEPITFGSTTSSTRPGQFGTLAADVAADLNASAGSLPGPSPARAGKAGYRTASALHSRVPSAASLRSSPFAAPVLAPPASAGAALSTRVPFDSSLPKEKRISPRVQGEPHVLRLAPRSDAGAAAASNHPVPVPRVVPRAGERPDSRGLSNRIAVFLASTQVLAATASAAAANAEASADANADASAAVTEVA
jgi:hypothetical protein